METTTVKGDVFIIPNAHGKAWETMIESQNSHREFLGLSPLKVGDDIVEIWATSPESESWSDHGIKFPGFNYTGNRHESRFKSLFPRYLKLEEIKGIKEGDTLTLNLKNGVAVELTANQKNYRYKNFGRFEEVVKMVVE